MKKILPLLFALPLIPLYDVVVVLLRACVCLALYPLCATTFLLCYAFKKKDLAYKVLEEWRKCANVGTIYEE